MAAFSHAERPLTPRGVGRHGEDSPNTFTLQLPHGACNFRDLTASTPSLSCGCRRFWYNGSNQEPREGGNGQRRHNDGPFCICGHHACFHDTTSDKNVAEGHLEVTDRSRAVVSSEGVPVYIQLIQPTSDGRFQVVATTRPPTIVGVDRVSPDNDVSAIGIAAVKERQNDRPAYPGISSGLRDVAVPSKATERAQSWTERSERAADQYSLSTTTGLPRVPVLTSNDSRPLRRGNSQARHAGSGQENVKKSGATAGASNIGLGLRNVVGDATGARAPSVSVDENIARFLWPTHRIANQTSRLPSTVGSVIGDGQRASPSRAFMNHVMESRRPAPSLNVPYMLPAGLLPEDVILSATEVNTPSNAGTPDLRGFDQTVLQAKTWVEALNREVIGSGHSDAPIAVEGHSAANDLHSHGQTADTTYALNSNAVRRSSPSAMSEQPTTSHASLAQLGSNLQRLLPYLSSIQTHLQTLSNNPSVLQSHSLRLDALENASFNHIPVEELMDKFELVDGRLLDVEGWKEDHDKLHAAIDADSSSTKRRRLLPMEAGPFRSNTTSFASNGSAPSATSSTVVVAAVDSAETKERLDKVERRLCDLEASALPSFVRPWDIEVVFLPWGRELKGIWFSPDDAVKHGSGFTTQNSEEWTQARMPGTTFTPLTTNSRDGWSNEAIRDWAGSTDDWLSPKTCGPKGLTYKRLRSRGLVRSLRLTSCGPKEVMSTVCATFGDLIDTLTASIPETISGSRPEIGIGLEKYHGLQAPWIPLRKVHKSTRLHFLDPAEMVTAATWTADFLSSGVLMKAAGGQRRLFITQRDAYIQQGEAGWTWQKLRELPRRVPDSQDPESHVGEADAKEACWAYDPSFDPPPSANSSFSSDASHRSQHEACPAQAPSSSGEPFPRLTAAERRVPPSEVSHQLVPPMSPLSEFPLAQLNQNRRTVSMPLSEEEVPGVSVPKRRIMSFENPSVSNSNPKRRRLSRSSGIERHVMGFTPRRSRGPPSPFFSEHLTADGRSQLMYKGGGTPFAYVTPHSNALTAECIDTAGDTGPETTIMQQDLERAEEEWEGVEDGDHDHAHHQQNDDNDESGDSEADYGDSEFEEVMDDVASGGEE
ncbi:hypothetical protein LTR16_001727 [Cryomyces antarcticus]|uniref:Uncharacterized protein n=1 Tax=Cryomyces antarcticus TaxID=329879 RepID=A0ABR0MAI0_9PEZI|nr:hypothetical protein LTR16_001727 [Cryomyces antarcticus]